MNEEKEIIKDKITEIEECNCNDETQLGSNCTNSFLENNFSINTTLNQSSFILNLENTKKEYKIEKREKNKERNIPLIKEEFKEQIEKIVEQQFEEYYEKLNNEYEDKIEILLNEQDKIFNKNQILKSKYNALEKYLKNYCKKANIDYESLLSD